MDKRIVKDIISDGVSNNMGSVGNIKHSFLTREHREERKSKLINRELLEKQTGIDGSGKIKRFSWQKGGAILIVVVVAIFAWFTLNPKATVDIIPKSKIIEIDSTLKAYRKPETPLILGFSVKSTESTESLEVETSGTKYVERKATGKLTVFNAYSKEPVKIIPNTRFKSVEGRVFRARSSFYIPGMGKVDGKDVPGSIDIVVTATLPGAEYNIGPGEFNLPGLSGSDMQGKIYAKSVTSLSGGFKGEAPVILDSDLDSAKRLLQSKIDAILKEKIKETITGNDLMLENTLNTDYKFDEYENYEAKERGKSALKMTGIISVITLDKSAFSRSLVRRELSGLGDEIVNIDNFQDLKFELSSYDNLSSVKDLSIRVRGQVMFVWQFDISSLTKDLVGIPKTDYSSVFANYQGIESAVVNVRPFWRYSFPTASDDIIVKVATSSSSGLIP
ncbi:MAG: hypothetical protein A2749_01405 [Parcubacteria group bacterium RIFCSPHIGHO2_01_FULL_45_26]|nr:MAG: hypothetical protein A2749_01405 [Parcubacteria group bacterium RIFCSPHIGHO2_01_FULL_45_26]